MIKKILKFFDITTIKFLMVGVINTLVGTGLMFILYNVFSVNYWISSASNYIVGSIVSYFLNKYFTFQNKVYFPEQRKILETDIVFYCKYYGVLPDSLRCGKTCSILDIQRI